MPVYCIDLLKQYKSTVYVTAENEEDARAIVKERAGDDSLIEHTQEWWDPTILRVDELQLGASFHDISYMNKKDD